MKKVLIFTNSDVGLFQFRRELLEELVAKKNNVLISVPEGDFYESIISMGCAVVPTPMNRRGISPLKDVKLFFQYIKLIKKINPDMVLTYTIKPNIYGGLACRLKKTPCIANITGLGTSIEKNSLLSRFILFLYKMGTSRSQVVFFQNKSNKEFFEKLRLVKSKMILLPGSGVNLNSHCFENYPDENQKMNFIFIGRIMKNKGIDEYFECVKQIKEKHPNVIFHIVGDYEEDYRKKIDELVTKKFLFYHGEQRNVHDFIKTCHATILPSYHEGLSNVLLETAACGRPVLTTTVPGCKETFEEGLSGFGFEPQNAQSLIATVEKFIVLPYEQKKAMGLAARKKVEREFDRQIVVDTYMKEIELITQKGVKNA